MENSPMSEGNGRADRPGRVTHRNEASARLFAGISWDEHGFNVAIVDALGIMVAPSLHFPAGQVIPMIDYLHRSSQQHGQPVICVIDSSTGMIGGRLLGAGICVYRADPWILPDRPAFGSVTAESLARAAPNRLSEMSQLKIGSASLIGRLEEVGCLNREVSRATGALTNAGHWLYHGSRAGDDKVIALTFDDGPSPPFTGRILDVLASYGVPATFFCVGLLASTHTEEMARMAEAGHQLGNHTWSHAFLPDLSLPELDIQIQRTDEAIAKAANVTKTRLFRPPYGVFKPEFLPWLASGENMPLVVLWDVEAGDWAKPGRQAIERAVLEQAQPGSIVLLHDGGGDRSQTVEALPPIIDGLLAQGYRCVLIDELLGGPDSSP
jgi:peptidoglycan/xylan/chitin deacetylase (PgdA/CDA1 family)